MAKVKIHVIYWYVEGRNIAFRLYFLGNFERGIYIAPVWRGSNKAVDMLRMLSVIISAMILIQEIYY